MHVALTPVNILKILPMLQAELNYIRLSVVLTKPVTGSGDIATGTVNFTIAPQVGSGETISGIRILNSSTETATFYLDYKVDCYKKGPLKGDFLFMYNLQLWVKNNDIIF